MQDAVWLASIFGPVMVIISAWLFFKEKEFEKIWSIVKDNAAALYFISVARLFVGFTILSIYCFWSWHLAVLVTILGWVIIAKGLALLFFPAWCIKQASYLVKNHHVRYIALIPFVWGVCFLILAYMIG
jgi:hypothetical protein